MLSRVLKASTKSVVEKSIGSVATISTGNSYQAQQEANRLAEENNRKQFELYNKYAQEHALSFKKLDTIDSFTPDHVKKVVEQQGKDALKREIEKIEARAASRAYADKYDKASSSVLGGGIKSAGEIVENSGKTR